MMIKRLFSAAVSMVVAGLLVSVSTLAAQQLQIGYINSQELMDQWPAAQEAVQEFQREVQEYQQRVQSMEEELGTMREEFEQQQGTLSQDAQQQRMVAMQEKFGEYQQDIGRLEGELETSQQSRMERLRERITTAVEEIRAERELALVLDVASAGVVASDQSLDLTSEVLGRLSP